VIPEAAYPSGQLVLQQASGEQPFTLTYLAFQPTRFTLLHVTITSRELLPHIFTLTPQGGGYFLRPFLSIHRSQ